MRQVINIRTGLPGPKSNIVLKKFHKLNGGWSVPYPLILSNKGKGCYTKDIDGNTFLDFACQIASNPLGYNHPDLVKTARRMSKNVPIKRAGQDFPTKEHVDMIEELMAITPKQCNAAFLSNSGSEAVENAIKVAMYQQKRAKVVISFQNAFHGRTLGALSLTNSSRVQRDTFMTLNARRLPVDDTAIETLDHLLKADFSPKEIACVIVEPVQGEGGYNVVPFHLMQQLRKWTKTHGVPFICDEVQAGMGRTGKWWSYQHSNITPDIQTAAKALQIGATIAKKSWFPPPGGLSSTWGGGHLMDMALGMQTIQTIKHHKLLPHITRMGEQLRRQLQELADTHPGIVNVRGLGLMNAVDMPSTTFRDNVLLELMKQGIMTLGCGSRGIRLLPPFIVGQREIDTFISTLARVYLQVCKRSFKHTGVICTYKECGHNVS